MHPFALDEEQLGVAAFLATAAAAPLEAYRHDRHACSGRRPITWSWDCRRRAAWALKDTAGGDGQDCQLVARTASLIRLAAAPGWEIIDRWPALTYLMCEPARLAMATSSAGGMTWSAVPMSAHDGMVRQAGTPDFSDPALERDGPLAHRQFGCLLGGHAVGETLGEAGVGAVRSDLEVGVHVAGWAAGVGDDVEAGGGIETRSRHGGGEPEHGVTLLWDEGVDIDQRLHVGVSGGGVGDDGPTVGVPHQDDGARDGAEEVSQVGGVAGEAAERVGRGVRRCSPRAGGWG